MTKIDPSLYLSNQSTNKTGGSNLGRDQFLKILMVQLQNQDPLEPMKDQEFIAQMATFSSLEQLMNISKSMDNFLYNQSTPSIVEYSHLIGKQIDFNIYNEDGLVEKVETGVVNSVSYGQNGIQLILENGEKVSIYDIVEISQRQEETKEVSSSTNE